MRLRGFFRGVPPSLTPMVQELIHNIRRTQRPSWLGCYSFCAIPTIGIIFIARGSAWCATWRFNGGIMFGSKIEKRTRKWVEDCIDHFWAPL